MFYRVDYVMAVLGAGFLLGLLCGGWTRRFAAPRLARAYLYAVLTVLAMVCIGVTYRLTLGHGPAWIGIINDVPGLLYGWLFGMAARRDDRRALLLDPAIFSALYIPIAVTFATAGLGKAFSMAPMYDFFAQSGYSDAFLRFIVIAEVLGALGMLIPFAMPLAMLGFSVDMFGALLTHIHNGDPLNDSTGAIAMLIRLAVLGVLWEWNQSDRSASIRKPLLRVAAAAAVCLLIAAGGGVLMRHGGHAMAPVAALRQ